jgi:hypothetical protein
MSKLSGVSRCGLGRASSAAGAAGSARGPVQRRAAGARSVTVRRPAPRPQSDPHWHGVAIGPPGRAAPRRASGRARSQLEVLTRKQ